MKQYKDQGAQKKQATRSCLIKIIFYCKKLLNVKTEVHYITILNDVLLTLNP
jgi:hypothetical protein